MTAKTRGTKLPVLVVTFKDGKVGRDGNVPPLDVPAARNADDVATAVLRYARKHLASKGVGVGVDLGNDGHGSGELVAGWRTVAEFTIAPRQEATP